MYVCVYFMNSVCVNKSFACLDYESIFFNFFFFKKMEAPGLKVNMKKHFSRNQYVRLPKKKKRISTLVKCFCRLHILSISIHHSYYSHHSYNVIFPSFKNAPTPTNGFCLLQIHVRLSVPSQPYKHFQ